MLAVLLAAHSGAVRFNEFKRVLVGLPARTLVTRLLEAEEAGLLERVVVDARPPRVEYRLTGRGRKLSRVVEALAAWAAEPAPRIVRR
jgi:DNA-binding HxlR family transcriptional regulator